MAAAIVAVAEAAAESVETAAEVVAMETEAAIVAESVAAIVAEAAVAKPVFRKIIISIKMTSAVKTDKTDVMILN